MNDKMKKMSVEIARIHKSANELSSQIVGIDFIPFVCISLLEFEDEKTMMKVVSTNAPSEKEVLEMFKQAIKEMEKGEKDETENRPH